MSGKILAFSHIENVFYFCTMQVNNNEKTKIKKQEDEFEHISAIAPQVIESQQVVRKKGKGAIRGADAGNRFSSTNQPTPEAKRAGWQEVRKQRLLTQGIIALMVGKDGKPTDTFKGYLRSLVDNAKMGNAKAIEALNKIMEDDILKIAQVDTQGNDKPNVNFNLVITPPSE